MSEHKRWRACSGVCGRTVDRDNEHCGAAACTASLDAWEFRARDAAGYLMPPGLTPVRYVDRDQLAAEYAKPEDACRFVKHDVTEDEARALLGDAFHDLQKRGAFDDGGSVTITSIDMSANTLTFDRNPCKVTASPGPDDYIFLSGAPEEPPSPVHDATMNRHERRRRDALARRGKR